MRSFDDGHAIGRTARRALAMGTILLTACGGNAASPSISSAAGSSSDFHQAVAAGDIAPACPVSSAVGQAHCLAYYVTAQGETLIAPTLRASAFEKRRTSSAPPAAMTPQQLQAAYGLTASATSNGTGRTVALIESGDYPVAEQDLAAFRSAYGLPPCTSAAGCFRKVAQDGSTNYPAVDLDWSVEAAIDMEVVSSICPRCNILLVEASAPQTANLAASVNTAASLGAFAISNSYAIGEDSSLLQYAPAYSHAGATVVAASGDGVDTGPQFPASFSTVIAVGGTTLVQASTARGWSETAWSGTGGIGCSTLIAKPSWQTDAGCSMRTTADIAFTADAWNASPQNVFLTYDSLDHPGGVPGGWYPAVGTSFGSPAIAAMYALAGVVASNASGFYASSNGLTDIISGSTDALDPTNGLCLPNEASSGAVGTAGRLRRADGGSDLPAYYCTAQTGYDAPTGNGTPYGLNAFVPVGATPVPVSSPCALPTGSSSPDPHPTQNPNASSCSS